MPLFKVRVECQVEIVIDAPTEDSAFDTVASYDLTDFLKVRPDIAVEEDKLVLPPKVIERPQDLPSTWKQTEEPFFVQDDGTLGKSDLEILDYLQ